LLVRRLWLTDFRSYADADVSLSPGVTAILGANGQGKTNLLEGLGYVATLDSFRGAPVDALIRSGSDTAIVRAECDADGREVLIEAELSASGRGRVYLNKQRLQRARDLLGALRVTVFAPDDLELVKGAPAERRRFLDDALVALHPRHDQLRGDLDRVLRQRNTLLKQAAGGSRFDESAAFTLEVWDAKLIELGEALAVARRELVTKLEPRLQETYAAALQPQLQCLELDRRPADHDQEVARGGGFLGVARFHEGSRQSVDRRSRRGCPVWWGGLAATV